MKDESKSISTGDDISPTNHKKIVDYIRRKYLLKMQKPEELSHEAQNDIMNDTAWEMPLVGLSPRAINQKYMMLSSKTTMNC
jgi:hypothetical protein